MPDLSVIILSYNTKDVTFECLDRLALSIHSLNKQVEVIVVENGNDGTAEQIEKNYSWVKLVKPKKNTGFALGNNLGIKESSKNSKYYLFLNSDAFIEKDTLNKAFEFMENHSDCDVLGCQLKFGDGDFQPSAGSLPTPINISCWMLGLDVFNKNQVHPKSADFFSQDRIVGWVMGAFLFMKSEVVKSTQGFDEKFFLYMEEVDWCKRINEAGFKIWYTPSFSITHLDKTSSGGDKTLGIIKEALGLVYYTKKYFPKKTRLIKIVTKIGMGLRTVAFGIMGDMNRFNAHWQALKQL